MYSYETHIAIKQFHEAVLSNNNKEIEECIAVKLLDKILGNENDKLIGKLPKNTVLYRAREIKTPRVYEDLECGVDAYIDENNTFHCSGYNYYESKEAPLGTSNSGRNNILGMSYLYLSEDKYTACAEIKPSHRGLISLATFKVEKDMKILNFCDKVDSYWDDEFTLKYNVLPHQIIKDIFSSFVRLYKDENIYIFTQFVSDYVRKAGFDGIKYWGAANYGVNFTIFNSHKSNVSFVDSKIIAVSSVKYNLIDLESESNILPVVEHSKIDIGAIQKGLIDNLKKSQEEKDNG